MNAPRHAAFIMDGNGRWAQSRGLPRASGHLQGAKAMRDIVGACARAGLAYVSFFAFGVDNWRRAAKETAYIWGLVPRILTAKAVRELNKRDARFLWVGFRDDGRIPARVAKVLTDCERQTAENGGMTVCLAMNYSGTRDVRHAAKAWAASGFAGEFEDHLLTKGMPPIDLLVRTGGECRVSDFMLHQSAYAEIMFSPVLWPDYSEADLRGALEWFASRARRFGGAG